jgi:hypothetical protein
VLPLAATHRNASAAPNRDIFGWTRPVPRLSTGTLILVAPNPAASSGSKRSPSQRRRSARNLLAAVESDSAAHSPRDPTAGIIVRSFLA